MGKVINLFSRSAAKSQEKDDLQKEEENKVAFEEIIQKNKEQAERIREERAKKNKNVLRSYRIK